MLTQQCVIAALFLGNVQIAKDATKKEKTAKAKSAASSPSPSPILAKTGVKRRESDGKHIVRGVYLLPILRGRTGPQRDEEGQGCQNDQQSRRQLGAQPLPAAIPERIAPREKTIQAFVEP